MNPETSLCWLPFQEKLNDLRHMCLLSHVAPPHWERVENIAGTGTPDLNWAWARGQGHIELKYRAAWPVGEETPVVVDSVTPHQRLWWRQRWEAGGNIFVLLRVQETYLVIPGLWAALNLGKAVRSELMEQATLASSRRDLLAADVLVGATRGQD